MAFEVRSTVRFDQWLDDLRDRKARSKVLFAIRKMSLGNLGDVKPVGAGVSETRIHFGPGYRLYFVRRGSEVIILLCGGDKSSQTQDIKTAIALSTEV
ncbi:type II toxin-antitoxin system RelE/ParE family toxin [uncultured Brevundimonas sp.]|uniref:type II toxin-antitoxin system RelE/ParE family toxin n=1 Tax=uncultured Brevundimonas sp. TaxID=213418 RepID=UPI002626F45F|nr:type II toxin-antitoxin system RelE/ParE family toxin [uncultured Brevundimonas sp.]